MNAKEIIKATTILSAEQKEAALRNTENYPNYPESECSTVYEAINSGFVWDRTPEGHEFWCDFRKKVGEIEGGDSLPSIPKPEPKKMTVAEVAKLLGHEVEIVRG